MAEPMARGKRKDGASMRGDRTTGPAVGDTWRHREGKRPERVVVNRVWTICGCDSETMHAPIESHGAEPRLALNVVSAKTGKPLWWTLVAEFEKHYEREYGYV